MKIPEQNFKNHLDAVKARFKFEPDQPLACENPVFIFAAGWRSGSTLLQRMLIADPDIMIWGEPYAHAGIVQHMSAQFLAFTNSWPNLNHVTEKQGNIDPDDWIANMSPSPDRMRQSHRLFFDQLFGRPARENQKSTWGIKEVRLHSGHAKYLQWLFPGARFLWLVRNPFDAWKSYKQRGPWYYNWPDVKITNAGQFADLWNWLAGDFYHNFRRTGGLLLKYEELSEQVDNIGAYLGSKIFSPEKLAIQRGHAPLKNNEKPGITGRLAIRLKTRKIRKLYHYE
jgi:hypothetical protein